MEKEWHERLTGATNIVLGLVYTIVGIAAVLGATYFVVWLIDLIAG